MKALAAAQVGKLAQEAFSREHLRASPADRRQYSRAISTIGASRPNGRHVPIPPMLGFHAARHDLDSNVCTGDQSGAKSQAIRACGSLTAPIDTGRACKREVCAHGDREQRRRHRVRAPS